jgi:hypothetical protein
MVTLVQGLKSDNLLRKGEKRRVGSVIVRRWNNVKMSVVRKFIQDSVKVSVGMRTRLGVITGNYAFTAIARSSSVTVNLLPINKALVSTLENKYSNIIETALRTLF